MHAHLPSGAYGKLVILSEFQWKMHAFKNVNPWSNLMILRRMRTFTDTFNKNRFLIISYWNCNCHLIHDLLFSFVNTYILWLNCSPTPVLVCVKYMWTCGLHLPHITFLKWLFTALTSAPHVYTGEIEMHYKTQRHSKKQKAEAGRKHAGSKTCSKACHRQACLFHRSLHYVSFHAASSDLLTSQSAS